MGMIRGCCSFRASRSSFFCVGFVAFVCIWILLKKKKKEKKKKKKKKKKTSWPSREVL